MLGFTVPLFVLLGIEGLLALLLLGPRSLAAPALLLCKATQSSVRFSTWHSTVAHVSVHMESDETSDWTDMLKSSMFVSDERGP